MKQAPLLSKLFYAIILLTLITMTINKSIITIENNSFKDRTGRIRLFHGLNISVKNKPFIPDLTQEVFDVTNSFSNVDIQFLLDMGINIVRLSLFWEAFEIEERVYDYSYLDSVEKIVNSLGEVGIYTILENHQDLFSSLFCGEGVPYFYASELPYSNNCSNSVFSSLTNLLGMCENIHDWNSRYNTSKNNNSYISYCSNKEKVLKNNNVIEINSMMESFFNNENNILHAFSNYWKEVAKRFSNHRYVIGYEILNDPIANINSSILSYIPGYKTNTQLAQFYKVINDEIITIDPDFNMIFQPFTYPDSSSLFGGRYWGGFKSLPGSNANILSEHHYCHSANKELTKYKGNIPFSIVQSNCVSWAEKKVFSVKQQADYLNIPAIITEFGACGNDEACALEISSLTNAADKKLMSWIYYQYKDFNDNNTLCKEKCNQGVFTNSGNLQLKKIKELSRPYIQAFQSSKISYALFNSEIKVFFSQFTVDLSITDYTILYISQKLYSLKGFKLYISYSLLKEESNIHESLLIDAFTTDSKNTKYSLDRNISNTELNENSLNYIMFKFRTKKQEQREITANVVLAPSLRYRYNILHEERASKFMKFNIKISDINSPFLPNNTKDNIFYFRNKNINRNINNFDSQETHFGSVLNNNTKNNNNNTILLKYQLNNEIYGDRTIQIKDNVFLDKETGIYTQRCKFNEECLVDHYYLLKVQVILQDNEKDLIEWEFLHVLNSRIIINFN